MPLIINTHGHLGLTKGTTQSAANQTDDNFRHQLLRYQEYGVGAVLSMGTDGKRFAEIREESRRGALPECDGFDVVEQLGMALPPAIVFVTAYDQYALRAFELGALDYLLKPFDDDRFDLTLARAKERIAQNKEFPKKPETLVIKGTGQVSLVRISEIDWIEAADYYACVHIGAKTHLLRRRILELEQALDRDTFCRIHRSTIVNPHRVQRLELNRDGEYAVLLDNGTKLRLSRRYRKQLQSRLGIRNPENT